MLFSVHTTRNLPLEQRDRAKGGRRSQGCLSLQILAAPVKLLLNSENVSTQEMWVQPSPRRRGWKPPFGLCAQG